jgi:hypothetical protein
MNLCPSQVRGRREDRVRAAPAVSCAKCTKQTHTSIQVQRKHSGLPRAMVLTVSFVLFSATNSFCHRRRQISGSAKTRFANLCRLDISNGCQNHTTSPYASAPFVCARVHRAPNASASTASHPAFVTTRDPPLVSGVRRRKLIELICPTAKAEYFERKDWTTQIRLKS